MSTSRKLILLLAALCGLPFPARAQYNGSVSLQTVTATLATNTFCTGSAQNFSTTSIALNTAGFRNLGQIRHILTVGSIIGAQRFQAEIDGIDSQGNVFRISDVMEQAGSSVTRQGALIGTGNYTNIQVSITCSPGTATFSAAYQGDFGSAPVLPGSFLAAQIDHVNFTGASGVSNQQDNFQTPFGNSAGTLYFQYSSSSGPGGTITVFCNSVGIPAATTAFTANLANTLALQSFSVPSYTCPLAEVFYNGAGAGTVSAEYVFYAPGFPQGVNGQNNNSGTDPCQNPNVVKVSQPVNISSATTTQIVSLITGLKIYPCGFSFTEAGTTPTFQFVTGTGTNCGTGTSNLSGTFLPIVSQPFNSPGGFTQLFVPVSQAVCITTGGTTPSLQGYFVYVQQ